MVTFITASRAIVWDFDGTITPDGGYSEEIPPPRPEIVALMRAARAAGLKNVIASCRWSVHELNTPAEAERNMVHAQAYLQEWDIPYDELRQKPLGEIYVDDKACHANDIDGIARAIQKAAIKEIADSDSDSYDRLKSMGLVAEKAEDLLPGGKGDGRPDSDFDPKALAEGEKHELEHTDDPAIAREIAKDHLTEDPNYYKKIAKIEGVLKAEGAKAFFLSPEGELKQFQIGSTHQENVKELTGFDSILDAERAGWVDGRWDGNELIISGIDDSTIKKALELLPQEMLFVSVLTYGYPPGVSDNLIVDEGEDALDAWSHRKDPRHRVKASGDVHPWGCLMVDFPEDLAEQAKAFAAKNIPDEALYLDPEDPTGYGRETHIHTTVCYGLDPAMDRQRIADVVAGLTKPVKVRLGKISKFEPEKYDVIKVEVESDDLHALHDVVKALGVPGETYPDYKPHLTLAYVKKGMGDHLLGQSPFEGQEFDLTQFDYSCPPAPGEKDKHTKYQVSEKKDVTTRPITYDDLKSLPQPPVEAGLNPDLVREAVGLAVGEASMAWSKTPAGVFDSTRAVKIVDEVMNKMGRWGAFEAYAKENFFIPLRAHKIFAGGDLIFTDRYQALGIPYPEPETCCPGQCEGTGWVPVCHRRPEGYNGPFLIQTETDPELIEAWEAAEAIKPTEDGWHIVKCPTCGGTGKQVVAGKRIKAFNYKDDYEYGQKFWVSPDGELIEVEEGEGTHIQYILDLLDEEGLFDKVMKAGGIPQEDIDAYHDGALESFGDVWDVAFGWSDDNKWTRVWWVPENKELAIDSDLTPLIELALKSIEKTKPEMLFVKTLVLDEQEIPVDEGEDASTAWKNRRSVRKQVAASGILANRFDDLYKAANAAAQDDAKYSNALENPALAQEMGQFQQAVKDARSEEELRQVWDRFQPALTWEALEATVEGGQQTEEAVPA